MKTTVNLRNLACLAFLLALILTLASCGREPRYPRQLLVADSLTNVNRPHDADSLLRSYRDTAMKAAEPIRMYYQLLRMRTDDKLADFPKNDSLALALVDYYEHKGDKRLLPKAYYYAGRVFKELNNYPQALDLFQKAQKYQEIHFDKTISSTIYAQMAYIFKEQHLDKLAFANYRLALATDSSQNDTIGMIYDYRDIGHLYYLNKSDSALFFHRKAMQMAKAISDELLIKSIHMCLAAYYTQTNQVNKAMEHIRYTLDNPNEGEQGSVYFAAGNAFEKAGMQDSAAWYFEKVLHYGTCVSKASACQRLSEMASKKGDVGKALYYIKQHNLYRDSVILITSTESIALANSSYNYQMHEKARVKAEKSNAQKKLMIIILISLLIISFLLLFSIIKYNEKRKAVSMLRLQELNRIMKKKEEENLLYIANNNKRIEHLNRELDKVQNELDKSRIENEKLILQAANIKARNALESKDISVMKIRNSQIFAKMREHLLKGFSARDEDFNEIELLVNSVFPTFTNNLTKLINMSVQDYRVCLLLKCGFKPLEISMLTTHSPQSVSTTRSRLFKKCFGKKGSPSEWDSFITQFE